LYAGITLDELRFYIRMSQENARQRELQELRTKQLIQKTLEDIQRARAKEARAWAKEMRERELHPLRVERLKELIEKGKKDKDTLDPEDF
jgi:hypothetical protein